MLTMRAPVSAAFLLLASCETVAEECISDEGSSDGVAMLQRNPRDSLVAGGVGRDSALLQSHMMVERAKQGGSVRFCQHGDGSGDCCELDHGMATFLDRCDSAGQGMYRDEGVLGNSCPQNDHISYVSIPAGCRVTLFQHCNRGQHVTSRWGHGHEWHLHEGVYSYADGSFRNDDVSAAEVTCGVPTVKFCQHGGSAQRGERHNGFGDCCEMADGVIGFASGCQVDNTVGNWHSGSNRLNGIHGKHCPRNDAISHVDVPPGCFAKVWRHCAHEAGQTEWFLGPGESTFSEGDFQNDVISAADVVCPVDFRLAAEDQKCPFNHEHRTFRYELGIPSKRAGTFHQELGECSQRCINHPDCEHFSLGEHNNRLVCIGCTSLEASQEHDGFHSYSLAQATLENRVIDNTLWYETENENNVYHAVPWRPPIKHEDGIFHLMVKVKARNDAHIGIFGQQLQDWGTIPASELPAADMMYEIVIGGWGNTQSVIRRGNQGSNLVEVPTKGYVGLYWAQVFWITVNTNAGVDGGWVRVGLGNVPGVGEFMSWQDPAPIVPVDYGVMTGWGSRGFWNFAVQIGDNWVHDGCLTEGRHWSQMHDVEHHERGWEEVAKVRCCSLDGSTCVSRGLGFEETQNADDCSGDMPFNQAWWTCHREGMRLCSAAELAREVCCSTGCYYDNEAVWTLGKALPEPEHPTYRTENENNRYHVVPVRPPLKFAYGVFTFKVRVRGSNDAHIGIFTERMHGREGGIITQPDLPNPMYEIVIGGWGNTRSVIRRSNQGANMVSADTASIMNPNAFRSFWVTVDTTSTQGRITVGRGSVVGQDAFMSTSDPDGVLSPVDYGLMSGWGSGGDWDLSPQVGTNWVQDGCHTENDRQQLDHVRHLRGPDEVGVVRCCSQDGLSCMTQGLGDVTTYNHDTCSGFQLFNEAWWICEEQGMRLCSGGELAASVCCETGCGYDNEPVWTVGTVSDLFTPQSCGAPPTLQCAEWTRRGSTDFQAVWAYTCNAGHTFDGTATGEASGEIVCATGGQWTSHEACHPISCGALEGGERLVGAQPSSPNTGSLVFTNRAMYTCQRGYDEDPEEGPPTVECTETGDYAWRGACHIVDCGPPPADHLHEHAFFIEESPGSTTFESRVPYRCEEGYQMINSEGRRLRSNAQRNLRCRAGGSWSRSRVCHPIDDCVGHTCGSHGTCVDQHMDYECQCEPGFEQQEVDGEKICGNIDDCGLTTCGEGGTCVDGVNSYTCNCQPGWESVDLPEDQGGVTCARVECGSPPAVDHAFVDGGKAVFGCVFEYTCDDGYTITGSPDGDDEFEVECEASGQFSNQDTTCVAVSCGVPTPVANAQASTDPVSFPSSVTYHCGAGFTTTGLYGDPTGFTQRCTERGSFVAETGPVRAPFCQPIRCPSVPQPQHAALSADSPAVATVGQSVTFRCDEGYTTDLAHPGATEFSTTCQDDGTFTDITAICLALPCEVDGGDAPSLAPLATGPVTALEFNSAQEFVCIPGHLFPSGASSVTLSCTTPNGHVQVPACEPVTCPRSRMESLEHGSVHENSFHDHVYGDGGVEYVCDPGFHSPSGQITSRCKADGHYTMPSGECENIDDCQNVNCGQGSCVDGIESFICDCNEGFEHVGPTCEEIDDCVNINCGGHGTCVDGHLGFTCNCNVGYEVSEEGDTCVPKTCLFPPLINAHVQPGNLGDSPFVFGGAHRVVPCDEGYSRDGQPDGEKTLTLRCDLTGSEASSVEAAPLLDGVAQCLPISCGSAPPMNYATAPVGEFHFGQEASYACQTGEEDISITITKFCNADGSWSFSPGSALTCETPCPPGAPFSLLHDNDRRSFPDTVTIACEDDDLTFWENGSPPYGAAVVAQCRANGEYARIANVNYDDKHGARVHCIPIRCPLPTLGEAMEVVDPSLEFTTHQSAVVQCVNGYSSDGTPGGRTQAVLHCHNDVSVSWRDHSTDAEVDLQCQIITHAIEGTVVDALNGEPVRGAAVTITNSLGVVSQAQTDDQGIWRVYDAPRGETTLAIVAAQYISVEWTVSVVGDIRGGYANQALSRILNANAWRAVLSWDSETRDLDTHVHHVPATGEAHDKKLWWFNRQVTRGSFFAGYASVVLDRDAVQFHQVPETATFENIDRLEDGDTFVYRVWDWCSSTNMQRSGAKVDVYNEDYKFATYDIQHDGTLHDGTRLHGHNDVENLRWDVFKLMWDAASGHPVVEACDHTGNCPDDSSAQARNHRFC